MKILGFEYTDGKDGEDNETQNMQSNPLKIVYLATSSETKKVLTTMYRS